MALRGQLFFVLIFQLTTRHYLLVLQLTESSFRIGGTHLRGLLVPDFRRRRIGGDGTHEARLSSFETLVISAKDLAPRKYIQCQSCCVRILRCAGATPISPSRSTISARDRPISDGFAGGT